MRKSVMLTLLGMFLLAFFTPTLSAQQTQVYQVVQYCGQNTYPVNRVLYGTMDIHGNVCNSGSQAPTVTTAITTGTADTSTISTNSTFEGHFQWKFGTIVGSYSGCTVQLYTSIDGGSTYYTLGSAASISVSSGSTNLWSVFGQGPTTTVTTTTPSSSAAVAFGTLSKLTFACSSYGTSAPVTISVLLK